jgi:hypothetical protein
VISIGILLTVVCQVLPVVACGKYGKPGEENLAAL